MQFCPVPCLQGAVAYGLCCGVLLLAGRGLLRLLRCQVAGAAGLVLAVVVAVLFWALWHGMTTLLPLPLRVVAPVGWAATLVLAAFGVRGSWPARRELLPVLLVCLLAPMATMPRSFARGLLDETTTLCSDGFNYMSYGKWLWDMGRGSGPGPSPVHQIGHCFKDTRYISAATLGFLSLPIRAGDTTATAALLQALGLFAAANAVLLFWLTRDCSRRTALLATLFTLNGGWMANVLWSSNYDQTLALMYMPAMVGALSLAELPRRTRWLLVGALAAGLVYTHLESAPMLLMGTVLIALFDRWREVRPAGLAWGTALAAATACVLLLPAAGFLSEFAIGQWHLLHEAGTNRGGGFMFREMLNLRNEPSAFWGLGGECHGKPWEYNLSAWGLTLLFFLGVGVLAAQRRMWGLLLATGMFVGAFAYLLFVQDYAYGAYKPLNLGWWCLAAVIVHGCVWLVRRLPRRSGLVVGSGLACAGLALGLINFRATVPLWGAAYPSLLERDYRQVQKAAPVVGSDPILLATGDWATCCLGAFHLCNSRVILLTPLGMFAPWFGTQCGPPAVPDAERYYVLTDGCSVLARSCAVSGELAWSREPYYLWRITPPREGTSVVLLRDQDGWGTPTGRESLRVEAIESLLLVRAAQDGPCRLSATLSAGPGCPAASARPLRMSTDAGHVRELSLTDGPWQASVPVHAGINWISLKNTSPPGAASPCYVLTRLRIE